MTPYYDRDGITVYCGRYEDVLAAGLVPVREVALIHDDPPYGLTMKHARKPEGVRYRPKGTALLSGGRGREWADVVGDDRPFEPAPLLALGRPTVLWGGNHFASRLSDSPAWFLWDKRDEMDSNDGSDGEAAWTNIGGSLRIFRHHWRGVLRASEQEARHLHPTQKPIALCSWVYARAKLRRGDLVFVPHMGSGPDLAACVAMGLRCIACEVSEDYCRTAIGARLGAITAESAAAPAGPLFAR